MIAHAVEEVGRGTLIQCWWGCKLVQAMMEMSVPVLG